MLLLERSVTSCEEADTALTGILAITSDSVIHEVAQGEV